MLTSVEAIQKIYCFLANSGNIVLILVGISKLTMDTKGRILPVSDKLFTETTGREILLMFLRNGAFRRKCIK